MPHVLDLLVQLALPGGALLLDVHQPVVEPVETVAQDGLVLTASGQGREHGRVGVAARPDEPGQGTEQQADHQGQQRQQDHHALSVAATADTSGLTAPRPVRSLP